MRFYKLTSVSTGDDYYINPNMIEFYRYSPYSDDCVMVYVNKTRLDVDKSDFTNMMILEGVDEYWTNNLTWLSYYYIIN